MKNHSYLLFRAILATVPFWALSVPMFADDIVYVSNTSQLGTLNLSTGAYQQIGPQFPDASEGLGYAANGSLLTMGFSGNLNALNPGTGTMTTIGPSGLSACPRTCDMNSVNTLASFNGQIYATDFANRLYTVNQVTGLATPIGLTGMPAIPFIPLSPANSDGTLLNVYDEALFAADGKLYATFDAGVVDLSTGTPKPLIGGDLYQIDPVTGKAMPIGPTTFGLGAAVEVNGVTYALLASQEITKLDLTTGGTTVIGPYNASAGILSAAVATPEPASALMAGLGLGLLGFSMCRRRRRLSSRATGSSRRARFHTPGDQLG